MPPENKSGPEENGSSDQDKIKSQDESKFKNQDHPSQPPKKKKSPVGRENTQSNNKSSFSKKDSSKGWGFKFFLSLLGLLVLAGAALGGYWGYKRYYLPKKDSQLIGSDTDFYMELNTDPQSSQAQTARELLSYFPYFDEAYSKFKKSMEEKQDAEDKKVVNALKQVEKVKFAFKLPREIKAQTPDVLGLASIESPKKFLKALEGIEKQNGDSKSSSQNLNKTESSYKGIKITCFKAAASDQEESSASKSSLTPLNQAVETAAVTQIPGRKNLEQQPICTAFIPVYNTIAFGNGKDHLKKTISRYKRRVGLKEMFVGSRESLASQDHYNRVKEHWPQDYLLRAYMGEINELWGLTGETLSQSAGTVLGMTRSDFPWTDEVKHALSFYAQIKTQSQREIAKRKSKIKKDYPFAASLIPLLSSEKKDTDQKDSELQTLQKPSGFSVYAQEDGFHMDSVQLDSKTENSYTFSDSDSLAEFIGEKEAGNWVDFYFEWASLKGQYDKLKKQSLRAGEREGERTKMKKQIEKKTKKVDEFLGLDVEDKIIGELDQNYSIFVAPGFKIGKFKLPALGAVFKLKNPDEFADTLDAIKEEFSAPYCYKKEYPSFGQSEPTTREVCQQRKLVKKDGVYYLPKYKTYLNIKDGKLIIATDVADSFGYVGESKSKLAQSKQYKKHFSSAPSQDLNSISYIYTKGIWGLTKNFMGVLGPAAGLPSSAAPSQSQVEKLDRIVTAYTDVLKTIGSYTYFEDSNLVTKTLFSFEKLPDGKKEKIEGLINEFKSRSKIRARDGKRASGLRQIELALELYYSAHREYPRDNVFEKLIKGDYLKMDTPPSDPTTGSKYCYAYGADDGLDSDNGAQYYHLGAVLEDKNSDLLLEDKDAPAINTWSKGCEGDCFWYSGVDPEATDCDWNKDGSNFSGADEDPPTYDRAVLPGDF